MVYISAASFYKMQIFGGIQPLASTYIVLNPLGKFCLNSNTRSGKHQKQKCSFVILGTYLLIEQIYEEYKMKITNWDSLHERY